MTDRVLYFAITVCILALFALLAFTAGVAHRVAEQRDDARARLRRVERGCAVRLPDGYAECKPGVIVWSGTTTTTTSAAR